MGLILVTIGYHNTMLLILLSLLFSIIDIITQISWVMGRVGGGGHPLPRVRGGPRTR